MSFGFGWLLLGAMVILSCWITGQLRNLGWIVAVAVFGSWAIIVFGPTQSTDLAAWELPPTNTTLWLLGQELDRIQVILITSVLGIICIGVLWYVLHKLRNFRISSPPHHEDGADY